MSKWEDIPNPNPKYISDNQDQFMFDNILNTLSAFGASISTLIILYGVIEFIIAILKKDREKRYKAQKIIAYGLILISFFAFIFAIMLTGNIAPPIITE